MAKPRIKVPKTASAGDVIKIKALLSHKMFDDALVFSCDIDPAVAANPYLEFRAKVEKSGTFKFVWTDDDGTVTEAEKSIEVT